MSKICIVLLMIFCHIVDDYYLQQGWLASAKQKKYWEENAPDRMYRYDYIWALIMHSFSWTFMIMLPITFAMNFSIQLDSAFLLVFVLNLVSHAVTDHLKANCKKINLIQDQIIHLTQIAITAFVLL